MAWKTQKELQQERDREWRDARLQQIADNSIDNGCGGWDDDDDQNC